MAKRNKTADFETENEKRKLGGKLFTAILIFLIIVVWLAIFGFIIKLDLGGLGTSLRPALKEVPILKLVLPNVSDEQLSYEENFNNSTIYHRFTCVDCFHHLFVEIVGE